MVDFRDLTFHRSPYEIDGGRCIHPVFENYFLTYYNELSEACYNIEDKSLSLLLDIKKSSSSCFPDSHFYSLSLIEIIPHSLKMFLDSLSSSSLFQIRALFYPYVRLQFRSAIHYLDLWKISTTRPLRTHLESHLLDILSHPSLLEGSFFYAPCCQGEIKSPWPALISHGEFFMMYSLFSDINNFSDNIKEIIYFIEHEKIPHLWDHSVKDWYTLWQKTYSHVNDLMHLSVKDRLYSWPQTSLKNHDRLLKEFDHGTGRWKEIAYEALRFHLKKTSSSFALPPFLSIYEHQKNNEDILS